MEGHKITDKIIKDMENNAKKVYQEKFEEMKKDIIMLYILADKEEITPLERYNLMQKKLHKLWNKLTETITETNLTTIKNINKVFKNVYDINYKKMAEELSLLLAVNIEPQTITLKELKDIQTPLYEIAIDKVKDYNTTKREFKTLLTRSAINGMNLDNVLAETQKLVEKKINAILRIARTEITRLENKARIDTANQFDGIKYKIWNTRQDEKVRPKHKEVENVKVLKNKPFIVGGEELMYPGDPNGSASNIINCRCFLTFSTKK